MYYFYPHFTDEETETECVNDLPQVKQLVSNRDKIQGNLVPEVGLLTTSLHPVVLDQRVNVRIKRRNF